MVPGFLHTAYNQLRKTERTGDLRRPKERRRKKERSRSGEERGE